MKVIEYVETVSLWRRGRDTVKIKVSANGLSFCCEYWRPEDDEKPFSVLRFVGTPDKTAADIKRHVQTIENFLFKSGYDGFFPEEDIYI